MALRPLLYMARGGALAALLLIAPRGAAWAQSGATDKAAAEALFQQGQALFKSGDYEPACAKFDASQKLDPAVGTLLFLGDCYEKTGKTASAWATFQEASSLAERTGDQRKKIADVRVAALAPQVSTLTIRVAPGNPEDIAVRRSGLSIPRASWGAPLPLDAGSYAIEASAPGKKTWTKQVEVKDGGDELIVDVPLLEDVAATAAPEEAGPADSTPPPVTGGDAAAGGLTGMHVAGIVVGGLGLVGLGVGTAFGALAISKNNESKSFCRPEDETLCSQRGVELRGDAQDRATVSSISLAAGSVLLAGGVVMLVVASLGDGGEQAGLWLVPSFGPRGGGLGVEGAF